MRAPLALRGHPRGRKVPPKCVCGAEEGRVVFVGLSRTWVGALRVEIWGDPCFAEESPEGRRGAPSWAEGNRGCCHLMAWRGQGSVPPTSMGGGRGSSSVGL